MKTLTENKFTELGNSYWNGTGAYQSEYENLYSELVPSQGEADTANYSEQSRDSITIIAITEIAMLEKPFTKLKKFLAAKMNLMKKNTNALKYQNTMEIFWNS